MISKRCTGCLVSMDELSLLKGRGCAFSELLFIHSWLIDTCVSLLHSNVHIITAEVGLSYDSKLIVHELWNY